MLFSFLVFRGGFLRKVLVAGHIGVGHTYSHSGFIQDDSLGFSSALALLRKFYDFDTTIRRVYIETPRKICVETVDGGIGCATPRRGLNIFEIEILKNLEGADATLPHLATLKLFGKVRGGCDEVPTSVEYALSVAALNTVTKKVENFIFSQIGNESGVIGGLNIELPEASLSVVITVNGSGSGIGPIEDLEGNIPVGPKRQVMETLGSITVPSIILESKAFIPNLASRVHGSAILLRYNKDYDNVVVARAVSRVLSRLGVNYIELDGAFPRYFNSIGKPKAEIVSKIHVLASTLSNSKKSMDKVLAASKLAEIVCEDLGGVFFMSEDLAEVVGSAGLVPGTGVVVSIVVGEDYMNQVGIPYATREDADTLAKIALICIEEIIANYEEVMNVLRNRYVDPIKVIELE